MDAQDVVDRLRDAYTVERVFGHPLHEDGVTVIPVARVRGGGGAGNGEGPEGKGRGGGSGFGLNAVGAGAFVVRNGEVRWQPAVDVNRIVLGAQLLLGAALFVFGRVARSKSSHAAKAAAAKSAKGGLRLFGRRFAH